MSGSRFTGFRCVSCLRSKDSLVFADDNGTKYWFCLDCMKATRGLKILNSPYAYGRQIVECFECNKFGDSVPASKKLGEAVWSHDGFRRSKTNMFDVCEECFDIAPFFPDERDDDDDNDYYDDQDFHDQRERMRDERF